MDELFIMKEEKVPSAIVKLTIPAILSSLVTVIYNIIDTHFVSLLHDPAMIAATTVGLPLTMILQSFGDGIAVGSGSCISRLLGAGKKEKAKKAQETSVFLALTVSLFCSLLFIIFLRQILPLFNIEDDVIGYAYDYMFIILLGGVALIGKQVLTYLLRSQGIVRFPMIAIFTGIILNTVLDPLLMFDYGLGLGIRGAALATILSQYTSMGMMIWRMLKKGNPLPWKISDLSFDKEAAADIFSVGSAAFVRNALPSFSITFLIRAAGNYSTALVAAMGVAKKSLRILTGIFGGYSQGLQPFTAYNYGAGNKKRIKEALHLSHIIILTVGILSSFLFYFKGDRIVRLLADDPDIVYYSFMMLKGYAFSLPVLGIYHVYATTLQAFKESRRSFLLSISRQGLFYIPIVLFLPPLLHELGIYLAQPVSDWMTFFLLLYLCRDFPERLKESEDSYAE